MTALGEDLKKARESRSFAISDVARDLHIRAEFLEAIEAERWDAIGDLVSLRGLLRTYARFLGLDGGEIVERFNRAASPALAPDAGEGQSKQVDMKKIISIVIGVVATAVICVSLTQFVQRVRLHRPALIPMATSAPGAR